MADTVRTRHTITGKIDENTPVHLANHSVLGKHLEIVGPDAKPYLPEMHKPRTADSSEVVNEPKQELPEITPEVLNREKRAQANPKNSKD